MITCKFPKLVAFFTIAVVSGLTSPLGAETPVTNLRYHFQVGQEITYAGTTKITRTSGKVVTYDMTSDWTFWITERLNDDTFKAVVMFQKGYLMPDTTKVDPSTIQKRMLPITLHTDGHIEGDPFALMMLGNTPFPVLPRDAGELSTGYTAQIPGDETEIHDPLQADGPHFTAHYRIQSPLGKIYGTTTDFTATFDPQRGLITQLNKESTQTYGYKLVNTGVTKLKAVATKDPAWIKQLQQDAERYASGTKAFETAIKTASAGASAEVPATITAAAAAMEKTVKEIQNPDFKAMLDDYLGDPTPLIKSIQQDTARLALVLNKPAPEWQLEKIGGTKGEKIALQDLRGKVVVLDFWYRGCSWCIRSMPQLKQLVNDFKDREVAIIGINTDDELSDATFVMEQLQLNYPSVRSGDTAGPESITAKYGIQGFPTMVIIDQQGVVRDIEVGFVPDLRTKIGQSIEGLLKK